MKSGLDQKIRDMLIETAKKAAENSYSPYSGFRVGASVLSRDGSIYQGTNIENRSYGMTICAEQSAVACAVSQGRRDLAAVAIYSPDAEYPIPPCGACRQVLSEFSISGCIVIMANPKKIMEKQLSDLLPLDSLRELKTRK